MSPRRKGPCLATRSRRPGRTLPAALVGLVAVGLAATGTASGSVREEAVGSALGLAKPNIVLILTDDQTVADMRVMSVVKRRLAGPGTTFSNNFSPFPQCCPARATLLTGQYSHNHHVQGNSLPYGGFTKLDDSETLPVWLQRAGYDTAIVGKYLNGYPSPDDLTYIPPGWTDWQVPIRSIYNYRHWLMNENGKQVPYSGTYQTTVWLKKILDDIDRFAGDARPLFLWAGFLAPHSGKPIESDDPRANGGRLATPVVEGRYRDALVGMHLPRKPSINEPDISDKPSFIRKAQVKRTASLREVNQQRRESLLSVNDAIGRILDEFKAVGEFDDTVFVFTSDNGFLLGEHRLVGKVLPYEESVRVPLIFSGPGLNMGSVRTGLVSLADFAPTVLDLAGATSPLVIDGESLLRRIHGLPVKRRSILFEAGPRIDPAKRFYTAIRTPSHVYIQYDTGETEFYDLRTDPYELDSINDPSVQHRVRHRLATALATLRNCAGASCR
jgi:N-acetylglucosamine-6-sulfatase